MDMLKNKNIFKLIQYYSPAVQCCLMHHRAVQCIELNCTKLLYIIPSLNYLVVLISTDFWSLHFHPALGKQRIADNPSLDQRSYEVIRPESASSPVISKKRDQGIFRGYHTLLGSSSYLMEAEISMSSSSRCN